MIKRCEYIFYITIRYRPLNPLSLYFFIFFGINYKNSCKTKIIVIHLHQENELNCNYKLVTFIKSYQNKQLNQ